MEQTPNLDLFMPRGEPSTECGLRSQPRRERAQEGKVTPTCEVLGSGSRFPSMVATRIIKESRIK
jgi:hypothetical protein